MTMSSKRLDVLTRVSAAQTERAAQGLAQARGALGEQQARLDELQRYAGEYRQRPLPMNAALLINRERFLSRLQQAEDQQRRVIERAGQVVQESTRQWMAQRQGQQRYDQLRERAVAHERAQQERRDQNQLDELALSRATRPVEVD